LENKSKNISYRSKRMKFEKAFDIVFNEMQKKDPDTKLVIAPGTAKVLAMLWSMLAVAENVLDDMAMIDNNNNIISLSIPEVKSDKKTKSGKDKNEPEKTSADDKTKTGEDSKKPDESVDNKDGKEKEKPTE
jgi:hypothetical protein